METANYNFFDTISPETYAKRGFIKIGDLIARNPGRVFNLGDHWNPSTLDVFKIGKTVGGEYFTYLDQEHTALTINEIETQLLNILNEYEEFEDKRSAIFFMLTPFIEPDQEGYEPVHQNECLEFRGRYEFIKAYHGWVLLNFEDVVHISHDAKQDFWDELSK